MHGNPDVYYNKAVNELMLSEYKAAAIDFSGALKFRSDDKEAYFGRGVAKMQMYQYKPAVADFSRAITIDSLYADAIEYRGISYASVDRLKEARRDLQKAARLNPEAEKKPAQIRQRQQPGAWRQQVVVTPPAVLGGPGGAGRARRRGPASGRGCWFSGCRGGRRCAATAPRSGGAAASPSACAGFRAS